MAAITALAMPMTGSKQPQQPPPRLGGSRGSVSPTAAEAHAPTHMGFGTAAEAAEAAGTTGPTRAAGASSSTGSASKAAPTAAGMSSRTWHIHSSSFYG